MSKRRKVEIMVGDYDRFTSVADAEKGLSVMLANEVANWGEVEDDNGDTYTVRITVELSKDA